MSDRDLDLIIKFVFYILSTIATACAVHRKGRSKVWVFFAVFFPPVFLIVELLPNKNKRPPTIISCHLCHKDISSEVRKCHYCGHVMPRKHSLIALIYERIICILWIVVILLGTIGIFIDNSPKDFLNISQNDGEVEFQLGSSYYFGTNGNVVDYYKAKELYLKADELGNAEAQYGLGTIFITGNGASQDNNKALYYFQKSCNNGFHSGCEAINKIKNFKEKYGRIPD